MTDDERARLRREVALQRDLERWIREALYGIELTGPRVLAATAVAAAAAEECYRLVDGTRGLLNRRRLTNRTSKQWRGHLDGVWGAATRPCRPPSSPRCERNEAPDEPA